MGKAEAITRIAKLVHIPDPGLGVGSSVPKALFDGACAALNIDGSGTMPQQLQRIVTKAGLAYQSDLFDSRQSLSGGGSTVTLAGLEMLERAIKHLRR